MIYFAAIFTAIVACTNRRTYNCETLHDAGGFLGVQAYTTDKKFKGTPSQKTQYEINNTNDKKITTCY